MLVASLLAKTAKLAREAKNFKLSESKPTGPHKPFGNRLQVEEVDSGNYDRVERRDSEGLAKLDRAYAMTNPQEFFAESTEAFFSRNDFYPYDRKELNHHDPSTLILIANIWGVPPPNPTP